LSGSPSLQNVGMAISTHDESAVSASLAALHDSPQSPLSDTASRFGSYPQAYPSAFPALSRPSPSIAASSRTGWGSGRSISEASHVQSSIFLSEWGRDRKTVSKINKTIGEMWIDVRVVRSFNSY
jgi:hypothetical protein